ncbi:MAG: DNA polymerase I [Rhodothermia bacterium]|nr:MAG: DNA polymerase I [Rhodothermia bacterium]
MPESPRTLYLLDAMALAYRAHFIFISRPLINSKGQNTSATYGFVSALLKLIEDHSIEHMVVVFDAPGEGGTFRDDLYPEYKAHRDPPPEDLLSNLPRIKEVVQALDIPVSEVEGVEADDVIGTLARQAEADGSNVVIVSPDKDFFQLLSDRIRQFRPAYRGESFDPITESSFEEKYGLKPIQFIDVLALMGDAADNVPGVPGVGEKTAIKLLLEYGSVERTIEHAEDVKGKRAREGLLNHADDAILSKELVTILTDVPLDLTWTDFQRHAPDLPRIKSLFQEYEFTSLLQRILRLFEQNGESIPPLPDDTIQKDLFSPQELIESAKIEPALIKDTRIDESSVDDEYDRYSEDDSTYKLISNEAELSGVVEKLSDADRLSFDTETTSTDPMMASLVGVSLSVNESEAWYIPTPMPDGTSTEAVLHALEPILCNASVKIGQNIKYDYVVLARHGLRVGGNFFDTMISHYLVSPEDSHGMDVLARRYLKYEPIPISSLIGKGKPQRSMRDVPIQDVTPYACEDADITLKLSKILSEELERGGVTRIAEEIEFPLIRVLADMEMAGIRVDQRVLSDLSRQMATEIKSFEEKIYEAAGESFNIASTQQLGTILFEKLGMPVVSKTAKGKPSTRESVLKELATEHELPGLILDWRELAKLKSTYVDSLGELIHPETGRVHTSYGQTIAATGRLSSTNPNLQNIPIRTARGREIRKAFVASEGFVLMSADYAQIELRILAALSDDEALKKAFSEGADIHANTAALVFGVPIEDVTREQRSRAKEVNFGIPYGISPFGLAQRLRCPVDEARDLITGYQKSYSNVTKFLSLQVAKAQEMGYVETILGRRRYVPDINARNRNVRSFAERVAVNMPIQGTQADMIKLAMIRIHTAIGDRKLKSKMLLQVHDELVFEVPVDEVVVLQDLVRTEMVEALHLDVPIEVEIDTGPNWLEAH